MRKEAKEVRTINLANINGYHHGDGQAAHGYQSLKYFNSDRWEAIIRNDRDDFIRKCGKPLAGYGLEIETECSGIRNARVLAEVFDKIIFAEFPNDLFKMERDGSLGGDTSAECITQVMTKLFIRNHYAAFKAMYDEYFPAFGIGCGSGRCGMHVNISNAVFGATEKAQAEAVKKLLYIVNKHFRLFCVVFNRTGSTHYCSVMDGSNPMHCRVDFTNMENCKNADLAHMPMSHGNSCNWSHFTEGRIELRLVGGQTTYGCFRNTMESVFHVVEAVKTLSWKDLDDVTKIFTGCNQYVFNRLSTNCKRAGVITDTQLEAIRATVKREDLI